MKKIFITCFIGMLSAHLNPVFSQSDISMVTHWNNRANYNPATIARPDYIYLFSNVRNQWTGISGAPKVLNVQASGYVESLKSGFGISLVADKIGLTQALNPTLSYAFRIQDKNENLYSLGISGGVFSRSMNVSGYEPENISDPLLLADFKHIVSPDVNVGFEFQNRYFIGGLSTTHLLSIGNDSLFLNSNHRYAYMIFKNTESDYFNYHAGIQCVNRSNFFVVEGNAGVRFKHPTGLFAGPQEIFDIGISYRTTRQMSFLFGIVPLPDLRVGYAYNVSFIPGYQANGTHEIMLEYRIPVKEFSEDSNSWYY